MKITAVKKGFIMRDGNLTTNFTSYEYCNVLKDDVYLYRDSVLVAIYENREKFEEQLKRC